MALWRVLLPGGIQRPLGRQEGPAILVSVVETSCEPLSYWAISVANHSVGMVLKSSTKAHHPFGQAVPLVAKRVAAVPSLV